MAKKTKIQARQEMPATEQREAIHTEDIDKFDTLSKALEEHIADNKIQDIKLDKLMCLVELIPAIKEMVEEKRTNLAVNERFARWARVLLTIGGVVGAVFMIIQVIFRLEK
jgi:hypothetical protein